MITVRYDSYFNYPLCFLTHPFEIGVRHLQVAFCNGSQEALINMARERIIFRPTKEEGTFGPLTKTERLFHIGYGLLETAGYLAVIVPFIVALFDRIVHKLWPRGCPGSYASLMNVYEGGDWRSKKDDWRKNPFEVDGKEDPFYTEASWIKD